VETFTWAESPSSSLSEQPRVRRVVFGDGYEERFPDGLNPIAQEWDLSFDGVDRPSGDAIVAFFRAHRSVDAFIWWPAHATASILVVCTQWSRSLSSVPGVTTIRAHFQQVFEP
jgi:phage-related protein